ncbi:MAG TPA: branched-chain amino acid ABC transporter permease [Dehalococcoidia bacterium]|nr:branched-chain amino acid ABC transporter permease [Dehalococcoidia bacterium]
MSKKPDTRASRRTRQRIVFGLILLLFLVYPLIDQALGLNKMGRVVPMLIFVLMALGLNIVVGFAGLLDLGYVAFLAIGAYTTAFLTSPASPLPFRTDFWIALIASFLVAGIFGVLLGAPTLRLRGDYLAIVTLAFGEIVPRVFLNLDQVTRGSRGMSPIERPEIPFTGIRLGVEQVPWYYLILLVGLISVVAIGRLNNSRLGRAWKAMREDELAAASMGIDLVQTKLLAFGIGASFSGFAGAIFASNFQFIDPFQFEFSNSILVLSMVILGGLGNMWGVIAGGLLVGGFDRIIAEDMNNFVKQVGATTGIDLLRNADISNLKMGIFGLCLVLVMLLRPEGIFPSRARRAELHAGDQSQSPLAEHEQQYLYDTTNVG